MDPIDKYTREKKAAIQSRAEEDHSLVASWQQAHRDGTLTPELTSQVFNRFKPTIQSAIKKYKSNMTPAGLNTEAKNLFIESLKTYDPSKGAAFNTHAVNGFRRLQRRNLQAQGVYIPEGPAVYFGPAQRAHDELLDELGRPPTPEEHEQRLNEGLPAHKQLAPGGLAPVLARKRNVVLRSNMEGNPNTFQQDLESQTVSLARYDLAESDVPVYDAIYKDKVTSTNELAKRLGMSAPAVSRAKNRIAGTIQSPGTQKKKQKGTGFIP